MQGFSWIAALLTSMLKTLRSIKSTTWFKKSGVGVDDDNRVKYYSRYKIGSVEIHSCEVGNDEIVEKKNYEKMSKSKKLLRYLDFFTPRASLVFTKLRQTFVKAPILYYFELKHSI